MTSPNWRHLWRNSPRSAASWPTWHFALRPQGRLSAWRQQLDRLREAKEDLEADLARRTAGYRGQKQVERQGPDEVAAALPDEVALVDFLEYTHYSPPQGGKGRFQREQRLLAFVVRRGRPVALVPLGAARAIDESVRSWRRALGARQGGALQTAAAELGRRVWEPLRPHLGDARTVLIAPDGGLSLFPFAALAREPARLVPDRGPGHRLRRLGSLGHRGTGRPTRPGRSRASGRRRRRLPGRPGPARTGRPAPIGMFPWSHSAADSGRCRGPAPRPVAPANCSTPPSPASRPSC